MTHKQIITIVKVKTLDIFGKSKTYYGVLLPTKKFYQDNQFLSLSQARYIAKQTAPHWQNVEIVEDF